MKNSMLLNNTKFLFCLLLILNLCLIIFHLSNKEGFHSDEQWSYAHANSYQGAYLDKEINSYYTVNDNIRERLFNKYIDSSVLKNYLTVQPEEVFSYNNIYDNLKIVEHPPLYYILLHTICSFFPEIFSKWQAGILNLGIFILIYIMLFKLSKLILKDDKLALCSTILWGFSEVGIDTVIFLRMYVLQTLLCLCLVYETLKILNKNDASKKDLFLVFLYSFLGIFTQYNSIFFSFFTTVVALLYLLKKKNYKIMFIYGAVMLLSVLMLFVIFPQSYDVLFNSLRAKQVISNTFLDYTNNSDNILFQIFFQFEKKLINVLGVITQSLLSFSSTDYKVITFLIIMGIFIVFYLKLKISSTTSNLLLITILYFIYLLNMPYMRLFHSRYYMCLMPFIAILLVDLSKWILEHLKIFNKYKIQIIAILVIFNFAFLDFNKSSVYAFTWKKDENIVYNKIKNNEVYIDKGNRFIWLHSMAYYLANSKKIYITEDICDDKIIEQILKTDTPIVLTYSSYLVGSTENENHNCLENLNFTKIAKVCPSQHCYNVWEK